MVHYTLDQNREVESTIESHLTEIRDVLLAELSVRRSCPQAILLSGSFGRGEGSAWYQDGTVHIASDYEINVICDSWRARKALERARRRLAGSIPVPVSLSQITSRRLRQGHSRNLSFGPPQDSIYMYEIQAASRVLHGSLDGLIGATDPAALPPEEGILLVSNRMLEVIEAWLRPQQDGLEHALAKLVLACGDAVLLSRGLYHYSYLERAQRLADLPSEVVRAYLGDRFHLAYSEAVSRKLWPARSKTGSGGLRGQLPAVAGFAREGLRQLGCRCTPSGEPEVTLPISYTPGRLPVPPVLFEDAITWFRAKRALPHMLAPPAGGGSASVASPAPLPRDPGAVPLTPVQRPRRCRDACPGLVLGRMDGERPWGRCGSLMSAVLGNSGRIHGEHLACHRLMIIEARPMSLDSTAVKHSETGRPRVLVVGAVFPKGGGVGMANHTILSSDLGRQYELSSLDTGRGKLGAGKDSRLALINIGYYLRQLARLCWLLVSKRPRIVHQSVTCGLALFKEGSFMWLSRISGARVIAHIHGSTLDRQLLGAVGWRKRLIHWILRRPDALLVLSTYWRDLLVAEVPSLAGRVVVLPNSVAPEVAAAMPTEVLRAPGEGADGVMVLFLGSLGQRKGLNTAIEAAGLVRKEMPGVRFVFAGDLDLEEDRALVSDLRERAVRIGGIQFPGMVTGPKKLELLREAAMLILPSRHENQPIAILEAMAMGLPIVSTVVGGIPETVEDSRQGFLIAPGDAIHLAVAIIRLARDPELRLSMGRASLERFRREYHPEVFARRIGAVYEQLLNGSTRLEGVGADGAALT